MLFVYFTAWELSSMLVCSSFLLICFVSGFLLVLLEILFLIHWCKKQKASKQQARDGRMCFFTQQIT